MRALLVALCVACGPAEQASYAPKETELELDAGGAGGTGSVTQLDADRDALVVDARPPPIDSAPAVDSAPLCVGVVAPETFISLNCVGRPELHNAPPCCATKPTGYVWRGDPACGSEGILYKQVAFYSQGECWMLAGDEQHTRCCQ